MNSDYLLTTGLVIALFSIPAMLSAYADQRSPAFSMAAFLLGAATMVVAHILHPGGYALADVPNAVVSVIANIIN